MSLSSSSSMLKSKSPFNKKKLPFDFSHNAMMISSTRAPLRPSKDETQLKKVKKNHNDLVEKYDEMKGYSISQMVQLQLELSQANNTISHLQQEREMLLARIKCLEKETTSMTKSYQKPLNKSLLKSTLKMSTLENENRSLHQKGRLKLKTERSENSQTSLDEMLRTKKDFFQNDSELNDFTFVEDKNVNLVKFDKKAKQKSSLIKEDHLQNQSPFCGNRRCLQNYNQLQYLRDSISRLTEQLEEIYLKIGFEVKSRMTEKNIAEHKQSLQDLLRQVSGTDFFYKGKTVYLLAKIQQKVKDFTKTQTYKNSNPALTKIKQKISIIKKEQKDLRQDFVCESYDDEFGLKQTERLSKVIHRQYKMVDKMLKKKGIHSQKFDKLYEEHEKSRKIDWKLGICEDSDAIEDNNCFDNEIKIH